jgi:hypothetical protein
MRSSNDFLNLPLRGYRRVVYRTRVAAICALCAGFAMSLFAAQIATNPPAVRIGRPNVGAPAVPPPASAVPKAPAMRVSPAPASPAAAVKATNSVAGTNAVAAPSSGSTTNLLASVKERWKKLRGNNMALSIAVVAVCALLALILGVRALMRRGRASASAAPEKTISKGARPAHVSGCNVLLSTEQGRKLWTFEARSHGFSLNREYSTEPGGRLPQHVVARSWRALFQKKLNVALLPADQVFLKVVQLPRSTFEEMLAMVELQVEKLSPMPLAQVVWGIQVIGRADGNLDTVVVMIVSRSVVEEFLGKLEADGFLADRLELPLLDQLQATTVQGDGAYIYPVATGGRNIALVAWWHGGVLSNLDIANLADTDRAASLREQLLQMAWAGELDGWVTRAPSWTLVAGPELAALWEPALREGLDQSIQVVDPMAETDLAGRTAARAAGSPLAASLMPEEFVTRYRQQFVDRLWMRGLGGVAALYVLGVLIYFVALFVATHRTQTVERQVLSRGIEHTNALALRAQSTVLQDRMDLKFAGLDCWAAVARVMPTNSMVLDSFNFTDGRRLTLMGTAPADQTMDLLAFEAAVRKATGPGGKEPLFGKVDNVSWNVNPGNATLTWNLVAELKRTESK